MKANKFNGSFFLLLFSSTITIGIIAAIFAKTLPLFAAKVIYYCKQLFSSTVFQIPHLLGIVIVSLLVTALMLGILSFLIQLFKTNMLLKKLLLRRVIMPKRVWKIIFPLGLGNNVYLVNDKNLFSFCAGIVLPRIIITTGLVESLTNKELEAVFLHEQAHLQSRDPLKIILGKTLASMFFFLPIFSQLNRNMNATNEILADRFVLNSQRGTIYLRGALKKILRTPQVALATVPGIASPDHLEIRIRRLMNPTIQHSFRVSLLSIFTSLVFLTLGLLFLQAPVSAFQTQHSAYPSYFLCSADNACSRECQDNSKFLLTNDKSYYYTK